MKKIISIILVLLLINIIVYAQEENFQEELLVEETQNKGSLEIEKEGLYEQEFDNLVEEDIYDDIGEVKLEGKAGMTPDSALYFVENFIENMLVGNNPKTALKYKEEKILEVKEMVDAGNNEAAQKALGRLEKFNKILLKEVTPELDQRVRESSKATKEYLESIEVEGDEWDDVKEGISENLKTEDKIALAAKISGKISELCEVLSELDPMEYERVCKTDDDAPEWKKDLDKKLTKEQEKEAKKFFGIMSECFNDPNQCRCDDISIKQFSEKCKIIAPLAADCENGDDQACEEMENVEDPIDSLPDYLRDVMEKVEDKYGEAKHDLHIPTECVEEGALTKESCMKVMFKLNAPEECLEALESGKINPKNEHEAKKACEKIMFDSEAPEECLEAGIKDHKDCNKHMFKLDAPEECLDAGLTGLGRDDWKKCDAIRFKLDAPQECLDAGIDGSARDDWKKCELIKFKLDAPQECLDAGIDGSARDDWKKCDAIKFRMDAPQECLDAGLDGSGREDWKKCEIIRFKLEAHEDCLKAGLDGSGRNDWKKCQKIQFKAEAPEECLDAGLDGSGRRDWDECNKIREENEDNGARREDCRGDELHICEDGYCKCIGKQEYDESLGHYDDSPENNGWSECKDGCNDECPGASRTDCIDDYCKCYYDDDRHDDDPSNDNQPDEVWSECKDGCSDECPGADQTDCVNDRCKCYYNEDPGNGGDTGSDNEETDNGETDSNAGENDSGSDPNNDSGDINSGESDSGGVAHESDTRDSDSGSDPDSDAGDSGSSESGSEDGDSNSGSNSESDSGDDSGGSDSSESSSDDRDSDSGSDSSSESSDSDSGGSESDGDSEESSE